MLTKKIESPKTGRSLVVSYDPGANLEAFSTKIGAEKVYNLAVRMAMTDLGNATRAKLNDEKASLDDIAAWAAKWEPGSGGSLQSIDPEQYIANLAATNPELLAEVLRKAGLV